MMLSVRHDGLIKATPENAYSHIVDIQSDVYGFRPSALVFSLPRALHLWGLILLMVQAMFLTVRLTHPIFAIGLASLALLVVWGTGQVVFAEDPWHCNRLLKDWLIVLQGYGKTLLRHKW